MSLLDKTKFLFVPCAGAVQKVYGLIPSGADSVFSFTRTTPATVVNFDGKISIMPKDLPRIDYTDSGLPNLLLEPQRENLYLNSEVLVNQDVTTVNEVYTLSFYGTGTVDLTGTYVGSLVGNGGRVYITFTATAGILKTTVTGNVTNAQLEIGNYKTSYIKTQVSSQVRGADSCGSAGNSSIFNDNEGVLFMEVALSGDDNENRNISISDNTNANKIELIFDKVVNRIRYVVESGGVNQCSIIDASHNTFNYNKIAITYAQNNFQLWINGLKIDEVLSGNTPIGLASLSFSDGASSNNFFGKTNSIAYFNTNLTDSELQQLTQL